MAHAIRIEREFHSSQKNYRGRSTRIATRSFKNRKLKLKESRMTSTCTSCLLENTTVLLVLLASVLSNHVASHQVKMALFHNFNFKKLRCIRSTCTSTGKLPRPRKVFSDLRSFNDSTVPWRSNWNCPKLHKRDISFCQSDGIWSR